MVKALLTENLKLKGHPDDFQVDVDGLPPVDVALRRSGLSDRLIESQFKQRRLFPVCGDKCDYDSGCLQQCEIVEAKRGEAAMANVAGASTHVRRSIGLRTSDQA